MGGMGEETETKTSFDQDQGKFVFQVDVDHILKHYCGSIGIAQIAMITISAITLPTAMIFPVFGNSELPHRCRLDPITENQLELQFNGSMSDSFDKVAALVGPWPSSNFSVTTNKGQFGCERYRAPIQLPFTNETDLNVIPCDNGYVYKYSPDKYPEGIANEWDLVCHEAWKVPFSTSMYMLGMLVGFVTGGLAGDHFGRRLVALVSCIIENFAVIAVSLSPNYWLFIIFRICVAVTSASRIAVLLVLCMEITTAHQRSIINGIWSVLQGFILRAVLSPIAIWFPNWRWFHGILCMCTFFSFPCVFLFPESPRWLVSQNRKAEALHQLYKIHRVNLSMRICMKNILPMTEEDFVRKIQEEALTLKSQSSKPMPPNNPQQSQLRQIFRTFADRKMVRITIQCVLLFIGQLASTFGLVFYNSIMRANIYMINFFTSSTQLPASIISGLMYRYSEHRKMPIAVMYILAFVILLIYSIYNWIVKPESDLVLQICSTFSLILLAASLNMLFMYVPELFASEARALGLGIASGFGRIGGVICPFVNALDAVVFHGFPMIIYLVILFLEMLNLAWLPDTTGRNLLDNFVRTKPEEEGDTDEAKLKGTGDIDEDTMQPIWASTVDELIASTQVIPSITEVHEDNADITKNKQGRI